MRNCVIIKSLLLAVAILPATGCTMTRELWTKHTHQPLPHPQVNVACAPDQRLLVEYDEHCETEQKATRRAFWLARDFRAGTGQEKPGFVRHVDRSALRPVPVLNHAEAQATSGGLRVALSADERWVEVWRDGGAPESYPLPVYRVSTHSLFARLWKTPLTLIGDAAMGVFGGGTGW